MLRHLSNGLRGASRAQSGFAKSYAPLFQLKKDTVTEWTRLDEASKHVSVETVGGKEYLRVGGKALTLLTERAIGDISHFLRKGHLAQLRKILDDPEASDNDRFVALQLLQNANIASAGILPGCQDTGTAIVSAKRGARVLTDGDDEARLSEGVYDSFTKRNFRYSQVAPLTMYDEKNTKCNLPAQIDIYADDAHPDEYNLLFFTKGGGSANKTFLYQKTRSLLNPTAMMAFLDEAIKGIGTSACPPYHLAIVIGGLSAELTLKTVKMASARYYDTLPTTGDETGRAFRDLELEAQVLELSRTMGIGAQFGGKYFCHDVRVVRLPRHGASCPVGVGVSCSADRQALAKITRDGVFVETLCADVTPYLPEVLPKDVSSTVVKIDLNRPMREIRDELSKHPIKTRLSLSGTLVVARDIAHAKLLDRLDRGEPLPQYAKDHIIYYAGPAKKPEGFASGSFGPTTAGRMDSYVDKFMENGGSFITLAKGNRSKDVSRACKKHGGFYLGSIGGPAAILAQDNIKRVSVLDNEEDGMEAVWKIEVEDFPAFIVCDDKGNDFFSKWMK
jgi:fumarate hydratase class I